VRSPSGWSSGSGRRRWPRWTRRRRSSPPWRAALELDPSARDESRLAGAREGHLVELFKAAGFRRVSQHTLTVRVGYETFDEWWEPLTLGVGPAGEHVAGLDEVRRAALRDRGRALLPDPPFEITALAWTARGEVGPA
jgi:hypothetical protein